MKTFDDREGHFVEILSFIPVWQVIPTPTRVFETPGSSLDGVRLSSNLPIRFQRARETLPGSSCAASNWSGLVLRLVLRSLSDLTSNSRKMVTKKACLCLCVLPHSLIRKVQAHLSRDMTPSVSEPSRMIQRFIKHSKRRLATRTWTRPATTCRGRSSCSRGGRQSGTWRAEM